MGFQLIRVKHFIDILNNFIYNVPFDYNQK